MNEKYQQKITDCELELSKIQAWVSGNKFHDNVKFLVNYAIIKSCGTVEVVVKEMVTDALTQGVSAENRSFIESKIVNGSMNPSFTNIVKLLESLSKDWANTLKEIVSSQDKGGLKSLVQLRNSFSHGNSTTASIEDVINYFNSRKNVLEKLHHLIVEQEIPSPQQ